MKKCVTLLMVLVMVTALCGTASATTADMTADPITQDVWASFKAGTTDKPVISIDISWEGMSFVYSDTTVPVWNPEKHQYEEKTTEGGWLPGVGTITIRNNSNAILRATICYTKEATYDSVDMCFTDYEPYIGSAYTDDRTDGEGNVCGTPCQITVKTIPVGTISENIGEHTKIGTVSVTIDTEPDVFTVLDALNERIAKHPVADPEEFDRGTVHFAAGTDTRNMYALTEAALVACADEEVPETEKNVAINQALTAFYEALDIAQ